VHMLVKRIFLLVAIAVLLCSCAEKEMGYSGRLVRVDNHLMMRISPDIADWCCHCGIDAHQDGKESKVCTMSSRLAGSMHFSEYLEAETSIYKSSVKSCKNICLECYQKNLDSTEVVHKEYAKNNDQVRSSTN